MYIENFIKKINFAENSIFALWAKLSLLHPVYRGCKLRRSAIINTGHSPVIGIKLAISPERAQSK